MTQPFGPQKTTPPDVWELWEILACAVQLDPSKTSSYEVRDLLSKKLAYVDGLQAGEKARAGARGTIAMGALTHVVTLVITAIFTWLIVGHHP